jgi:hypothetical protein
MIEWSLVVLVSVPAVCVAAIVVAWIRRDK